MKDVLNRGKEAAAVDGLKKSSRQVHAACHAMEAPHHPIARTELTCLTQAGPSAQLHKTPAVWRVATATSAAAANQNCSSPRLQYPGSHRLWRGAKVNITGLEVPGSR